MPIRILKVQAASAATVIYCAVRKTERAAAVGNAFGQETLEYGVEFVLVDLEGIMMTFEFRAVLEMDHQGVVHPHGGKVSRCPGGEFQTENPGEKACRSNPITGRHDGVIQPDRHDALLERKISTCQAVVSVRTATRSIH